MISSLSLFSSLSFSECPRQELSPPPRLRSLLRRHRRRIPIPPPKMAPVFLFASPPATRPLLPRNPSLWPQALRSPGHLMSGLRRLRRPAANLRLLPRKLSSAPRQFHQPTFRPLPPSRFPAQTFFPWPLIGVALPLLYPRQPAMELGKFIPWGFLLFRPRSRPRLLPSFCRPRFLQQLPLSLLRFKLRIK